ncbi:SEC-C metal-binding domain-containing protein [Catenovulum maritimum]|uniref:SEC-C metal-binding domain-containing protein n=1 Tax=Catenovulum maritimum TaxID=1513271 RepID=UPI001FE0C6E9|nr:SEC-C metal-binding domain-containing protein [Catenovulum maritimum]
MTSINHNQVTKRPAIINETKVNDSSCCSKSSCCAPQSPVVYNQAKIGRNQPCPCKSGLKFKKCCG